MEAGGIHEASVEAGPAAAWFAQPGHGIQDELDPTLIPGAARTLDVSWLLHHGYLAPASLFHAQRGGVAVQDPGHGVRGARADERPDDSVAGVVDAGVDP
jgi:hypothetical protein